jgi:hypothetical protein
MGRILALALMIYGYGDPGFDGHRPAAFDRPLRNFHRAVDTAASQAQRILVAADRGTAAVPALSKLGDQLRNIGAALAPD